MGSNCAVELRSGKRLVSRAKRPISRPGNRWPAKETRCTVGAPSAVIHLLAIVSSNNRYSLIEMPQPHQAHDVEVAQLRLHQFPQLGDNAAASLTRRQPSAVVTILPEIRLLHQPPNPPPNRGTMLLDGVVHDLLRRAVTEPADLRQECHPYRAVFPVDHVAVTVDEAMVWKAFRYISFRTSRCVGLRLLACGERQSALRAAPARASSRGKCAPPQSSDGSQMGGRPIALR